MGRKFKKSFLWIVIFSFVLIIAPFSLNYAGFCVPQGRFIPDDEKIRLAIQRINSGATVVKQMPDRGGVIYDAVHYASVDEFLKENPNCCRIFFKPEGYKDIFPPTTFSSRIFGLSRGAVEIEYIAKYIDDEGKENPFKRKQYIRVNNCKLA